MKRSDIDATPVASNHTPMDTPNSKTESTRSASHRKPTPMVKPRVRIEVRSVLSKMYLV
jgi:hypothetical protein